MFHLLILMVLFFNDFLWLIDLMKVYKEKAVSLDSFFFLSAKSTQFSRLSKPVWENNVPEI